MQVLKKDKKKELLFFAKQEFLEHGFKDASMRTIAKNAEVSLGNIYNYFKNKDEIFNEVLSVVINQLEKTYNLWQDDYFFDLNNINNQRIGRLKLLYSVRFIKKYRDELNLLIFKSYGASLYNYKDHWIDECTKASLHWINKYNQIHHKNVEASEFFIHYLNSAFVNFISELLMHNISEEDMKKHLAEYFTFYSSGWMKLVR